MNDLLHLPAGLPIPQDDGACDHLLDMALPPVELITTTEQRIDLGNLKATVVLFFYPMNGHPDGPPMSGWNEIPGARGCTPQACAYRDNIRELEKYAGSVFGVSSQTLDEQKEAQQRLHLPYELLNDSDFKLTDALKLPTFEYDGNIFIKRLTLIIQDGTIIKVFYPLFPPDEDVDNVIDYLKTLHEKR